MIKQYRKKPIVIDAIQFSHETCKEVMEFVGETREENDCEGFDCATECPWSYVEGYYIDTLEGEMKASIGDYIIKGVMGEVYPCRADIFESTYDEVVDG